MAFLIALSCSSHSKRGSTPSAGLLRHLY
jgi:hypothetical protein